MNLLESGDGDIAILMLHGRGSNAEDIISLSSFFHNVKSYAFTAKNNHWYPKPFNLPKSENEPNLSESLDIIKNIYLDLKKSHRKVFLLGFSQGACLVLEYASKKNIDGAIAFSGGLIGFDDEISVSSSSVNILISCSRNDPFIPLERAEKTVKMFKDKENTVDFYFYEGSTHTITKKEIELAIEFINKLR